jgi:8-oxo-dGTP pyrophosphatase MutT (NUDIX family)
VRIVGLAERGGAALFDRPLAHGEHPETAAYAAGFLLDEPIDALRGSTGELVVEWFVHPAGDAAAPLVPARGQDPELDLAGVEPLPKQRVAAYALVRSARGLLATEFSDRTGSPGRWGLPGGGIEDFEDPATAVLRETVEETDQRIDLGELSAVQTSHWIGRSPRGVIQDFHAIRLVYRADCPVPTHPRVLDVGGTTASARWVPINRWRRLAWTAGWRALLPELLAG